MKILVTGADGLLGSNLVRELLGRNYEVTALVQELKVYPTLADLPITLVIGDLLDPISIHKALNNMEIVIHCAANTSMFGLTINLESVYYNIQDTIKVKAVEVVAHLHLLQRLLTLPMFQSTHVLM
jgi:dihydroflavonol-4-reductase